MHTIQLISSAIQRQHEEWLQPLPATVTEGICAVTGHRGRCLPRKAVLGKSFTNQNLLRAPESYLVGVDVFYTWFSGYKTEPTKKRLKAPERMSSWYVDEEIFVELNRQDVRERVLSFHDTSKGWSGYATTSYKKHGSLLAPVNTGQKRIWCFDESLVDCSDRQQVESIWQRINVALRTGFGRQVIETLDCPPYLMQKVGIPAWIEFDAWARQYATSNLYRFLCYLLPSQEELKHESLSTTVSAGKDIVKAPSIQTETQQSLF